MSFRAKAFVILCAVGGAIALAILAPAFLGYLSMVIAKLYRVSAKEIEVVRGSPLFMIPFGLFGLLLGAGLGGVLLRIGYRLDGRWDQMDSGDKVTLFVGVFFGLVASLPFLFLLNSLNLGVYVPFAVSGLTLGFTALSVYALQSMEEILPWKRGRGKGRRRGIKILDTNVIIDGRVLDVAKSGFLEGELYVPGFVLEELQYIADSHDSLKRQRGRRGLEILHLLQSQFNLEVRIHDRMAPKGEDDVDSRLVRLARALGADIVTNDYNLNRVASLQDVRVLNLHDLALGLRVNVLPKESLMLMVAREGSQPGQGVGYLEDGTMVVIENGKPHLGESIEVIVTQVIQTERGKMVFAELPSDESEEAPRKRTQPREYRR